MKTDAFEVINRHLHKIWDTLLKIVIQHLSQDDLLATEYRDHKLIGNFGGCRECHIEPDWLIIYRLTNDEGLQLVETGTHAYLFN